MQQAQSTTHEIHVNSVQSRDDDRVYRLLKKLAYANGEVRQRMRRQPHGVYLCEFSMADETYFPYQCHLVLKGEALFVHADRRYFWDCGYKEGYVEAISFEDASCVIQIWGITFPKLEDQLRERYLIQGLSKGQRELWNLARHH